MRLLNNFNELSHRHYQNIIFHVIRYRVKESIKFLWRKKEAVITNVLSISQHPLQPQKPIQLN